MFYCGRPGVPRVGPPRKIMQLRDEVVFLYEDLSGDTYRVIPTDGRAHRAPNPPGLRHHKRLVHMPLEEVHVML